MGEITIPMADDQLAELKRMAAELGVSVEDLAREGVEAMIEVRRERFRAAAHYVLEKNAELYRRLAR